MKLKKWLPAVLAVVALASLVLAIVLLFVAVPNANAGYKRVLGIISAILFIVLFLLIAYYLFLLRDTESNFFLFDRAKRRNIDIDQLTFAIVNERMNFFLVYINVKPEQLWQGGILDNNDVFGYRGVYRPLVAYKMLFDLADMDNDTYWGYFSKASDETMNGLCRALEQGGEREMVKAIRCLMEKYGNDRDRLKDFIKSNARYVRGRMMNYVKTRIEMFY